MKLKSKVLSCVASLLLLGSVGQGIVSVNAAVNDEENVLFDAEISDGMGVDGWTQLVRDASTVGDIFLPAVREAIGRGADINSADAHGYTPLVNAVINWRNSQNMISLLLVNGADPNVGLNIHGYPQGMNAYDLFEHILSNERSIPRLIVDDIRENFEHAGAVRNFNIHF